VTAAPAYEPILHISKPKPRYRLGGLGLRLGPSDTRGTGRAGFAVVLPRHQPPTIVQHAGGVGA
jgi:hypothetical protein